MPARPKNWPVEHNVEQLVRQWRDAQHAIKEQAALRLLEFMRRCPEFNIVTHDVRSGAVTLTVNLDGADTRHCTIRWWYDTPTLLYGYYGHSITKDTNLSGLLAKLRRLKKRYG